MKTVKLTSNEIRAIESYLIYGNPCSRGCAYPEMNRSRKDCKDCMLEKARISISEKLGVY